MVAAPVLSGCTLISVATMVGKRFVPALAKGDRARLKRHSSWRLAWYWDGFTDQEIQTAVKGNPAMAGRKPGKAGPHARRRKRRKGPGVSLVSFRSRGRTARLVARRGKTRFAFDCVLEGGRWRVDDITLPMNGRKTHLVQLLKVLLAAKAIQAGMERGSRYLLVNVSTPRLRSQVWDRLGDAELEAITSSTSSRRDRKGPRKRSRSKIRTRFFPDHAEVSLSGGSLPASITLLERDGQYWVDDVRVRLGGQWHRLADLVGYLQPALGLFRWAKKHLLGPGSGAPPSPAALAALISRLQSALPASLWRRSLSWLTPGDLALLPWAAIRDALLPKKVAATGDHALRARGTHLSPKIIERFQRTGGRLQVALKLPGLGLTIAMRLNGGSWRLHNATLTRKGNTLRLVQMLEALAPMARLAALAGKLVPKILLGNRESGKALGQLMAGLRRASSRDLNRHLWSRIPQDLLRHVPLEVLPKALGRLLGARRRSGTLPPHGPSAGQRRAAPLPRPSGGALPTLRKIAQTARGLDLTFSVDRSSVQVRLVKEGAAWKLDDVIAPFAGKQRSMRSTLAMMAPAAALAHALLSGKGAPLGEAFDSQVRRTVVDPLLRILGPRLGSLMRSLRTRTLELALPRPPSASRPGHRPHLPSAMRPRPRPRPRPRAVPQTRVTLESLVVQPDGRRAEIRLRLGPMAPLRIILARGRSQVWRVADVIFPLGGRILSLRKTGPVIAPLFGFGISLFSRYLPGIRRASSRSFNRAVWRRLSRAKLSRLLGQIMPSGQGRGSGRSASGRSSSRASRAARSRLPKLLALRIRDTGRWRWAEVDLRVGKRTIRISLVGARGRWFVHDVHLSVGGKLLSLKTAAALLL